MQKEIKVNFPIDWNKENGRMGVSVFKKVVRYLMEQKMLRKGVDFFITDSRGEVTCWTVSDSISGFWGWCVSVEFTEDETAKECDWYNALLFDKRGAKITDYSFESYRV